MASSGQFNTIFDDTMSTHLLGLQEGIALCSTVLILMLLIWTYFSFKEQSSTHISSVVLCQIKTFCFITIISYLVMAATMAILLNNFVLMSQLTCRVLYILYFSSYNMGNIASYLVMSFQIESIFPTHINKTIAIPTYLMNIYRLSCVCIPSALWAIYLSLSFDHIQVIEINQYKYCYAAQFYQPFWAQICLLLIAFVHTALISFFLFGLASTAVNYTGFVLDVNVETRSFIQKLSKLIHKSTILSIVSITSTVFLLCSSAYLLQQLIFFLVIDGVINLYCIACLLQIGEKCYLKTCGKMEKLCCCTYYMFDKYLYQNNIYTEVAVKRKSNKDNVAYNPPKINAEQKVAYIPINDVSFTRKIDYNKSITSFSGITRTPFTYSKSKLPYYYSKSKSKPLNKSKSKSPFTYSQTSKSKMEFKTPSKASVTHFSNSYDSQIFTDNYVEMQSTM